MRPLHTEGNDTKPSSKRVILCILTFILMKGQYWITLDSYSAKNIFGSLSNIIKVFEMIKNEEYVF